VQRKQGKDCQATAVNVLLERYLQTSSNRYRTSNRKHYHITTYFTDYAVVHSFVSRRLSISVKLMYCQQEMNQETIFWQFLQKKKCQDLHVLMASCWDVFPVEWTSVALRVNRAWKQWWLQCNYLCSAAQEQLPLQDGGSQLQQSNLPAKHV